MFALYMFGPDVERVLGARRFAGLLLRLRHRRRRRSALGRARAVAEPGPETIGASGGIFGLLLFYGMTFPQRRMLLLIPPIPMPAWLFVTLYGVLELYLGVSGTDAGRGALCAPRWQRDRVLLLIYWRWTAPPAYPPGQS